LGRQVEEKKKQKTKETKTTKKETTVNQMIRLMKLPFPCCEVNCLTAVSTFRFPHVVPFFLSQPLVIVILKIFRFSSPLSCSFVSPVSSSLSIDRISAPTALKRWAPSSSSLACVFFFHARPIFFANDFEANYVW
jgi:hypothetical protein